MNGIEVRRPSLVRWGSSSRALPFVVESKVMPNTKLQVWRTDGFTGIIPKSDWRTLTQTVWAVGKVHHIQNFHGEGNGYTRYDVRVIVPKA